MKFFADTANLDEIKYSFSKGVNDGITTNPKIMESTGDLSKGFENACNSITSKYPSVPVSLETDLGGMSMSQIHSNPNKVKDFLLDQAYSLKKLGENVVVKIPICEGGLYATEKLSNEGIKTNVTACMTPYQALEASKAGATYVSLFANRMLDSKILELSGHSLEEIKEGSPWKETVKENKDNYFEKAWEETLKDISYVAEKLEKTESELIVGSIRSPEDIYRIAKAEPQIITIPTKIVKGLEDILSIKHIKREKFNFENHEKGNSLIHPMTDYTIEEFEKAALSYK